MKNSSQPPLFSCIAVNQPLGTFFVTSAPAKDILGYLTVSRRGLSPEDRNKVQRALDPVRRKEIAEFVKREDATFPTSITINADSQKIFVLTTERGLELVIGQEVEEQAAGAYGPSVREVKTTEGSRWFIRLNSADTPAEIIDGQHRFEGLRQAIHDAAGNEELAERLENFDLTLAVMFDLLPEQCAKVFVTINATQRKVDSSLIADLFSLHSTRSPQRVCHLIAVTANELDGSPFRGGLKMLGKRINEGQYLSQGSFTKYLMTLLPRASDSGELKSTTNTAAEATSRPFSTLYNNGEEKQIAQIILNYFAAVAANYSKAWSQDPDKYLIRKTVGFAALIKLLRKLAPTILPNNATTFKHFDRILKAVAAEFPEENWAVGKFASSDAEAGRIANEMYAKVSGQIASLLE